MARLQQELKKRMPFASLPQEAALALVRTSDQLQHRFEQLFRKHGLTASQYNVLRIVRGAGGPLPVLEIASRTVAVVPGITGLVDRLEKCGLVRRERSTEDRRVLYVAITPKAVELLAEIEEPLMELHDHVMGGLARREQEELIRLLEKLRGHLEAAAGGEP